jgi:hypothetical protein
MGGRVTPRITPHASSESSGLSPLSILLSYRREDSSAYAILLYEGLAARFGSGVFMDIDSLAPGVDFVRAIDDTLRSCDVVLALIGPRWLSATDSLGKRRLEDDDDFVRVEIESALTSGVVVVPVLVGGATMPGRDQLPVSLEQLTRRNAFEVSDRRWKDDVSELLLRLNEIATRKAAFSDGPVGQVPPPSSSTTEARKRPLRSRGIRYAVAAIVGVAICVSAVVVVHSLRAAGSAVPGAATIANWTTTRQAAFWVVPGSGRIEVAVGTPGGTWTTPTTIPTVRNAVSSVVSLREETTGAVDVFYTDRNHMLFVVRHFGSWGLPQPESISPLGSSPSAVIWGSGRTKGQIDLFWKGAGSDTDLYEASCKAPCDFAAHDFRAFTVPIKSDVQTSPTSVVYGSSEFVFYGDSRHRLIEWIWNSRIGSWQPPSGHTVKDVYLDSDPAAVAWPRDGQIDLFWRGFDHRLYETSVIGLTQNTGVRPTGLGSGLIAAPTAVLTHHTEVVVFVGAGGAVEEMAYRTGGSFEGPYPVSR